MSNREVDYREAGSHTSAPGGDWDQSQEQSIKVLSLHVPIPEVWQKKSTNDVKGMRSITCSDCSFFLHACLEARESFTAKVL